MDPFMRLVKIFVVVSGILLIVGSVTLVVLLITRGTGSSSPETFEHRLSIPGRVASIEAVGERLAVLVEHQDTQTIVMIDPASGFETGIIQAQTP